MSYCVGLELIFAREVARKKDPLAGWLVVKNEDRGDVGQCS